MNVLIFTALHTRSFLKSWSVLDANYLISSVLHILAYSSLSLSLSLSVCLSVCLPLHYFRQKGYVVGGKVAHGTRNNPLAFGGNENLYSP